MTDWTAGYVADIGYTYGYYNELNPQRIKLAFLNQGIAFPEIQSACELGFGQGLSVNIHASASDVQWSGTDFNPSQAGFAQELAKASGNGAKLFDQSFEEFANRSDLPRFDFIGLHGIWSWISNENRTLITEFINERLNVGGVVYVSYNTLPGWAAFAPMRHLMTEHAEILGAEGRGIVSRIDGAMEFAKNLLETNPLFSRANPLVGDRLAKMQEHNRHYLAHEYFNKDWHPMHFATMANWLEEAKLQFACSAHYLDHIEAVNLSAEQQEFLGQIPDVMFRESVRDFMVNAQFRRDYWVKGARRLSKLRQAELLREQSVLLTRHRDDVSLKVQGSLGEADLTPAIYNPVLDLLADYHPRTLAQIETHLSESGISFAQIVQVVMVLCGAGHIQALQPEEARSKAQKSASQLNAALCERARDSNEIAYLVSPVSGGGFAVNRFQQLFVLGLQNNKKEPRELAEFAWGFLSAQGQKLIKEGATLETDDANVAELTDQASVFIDKQLPILKALGIA